MTKPVRLIPAILTDDPQALTRMVRQAETFSDYFQLDIMDGKFVPSTSISAQEIGDVKPKLNWEVHLMVLNPESYFADFKKAGAGKATFHYEATSQPRVAITEARKLGLEVGLAVNPETPVAALLPLVSEVDSVLLLTVHPGFYGSQFLPEVLDKVSELRYSKPDVQIDVDGGVKEGNIARIARSGVDVICVGSAIFLQDNPAQSYRNLLKIAQEGANSG